MNKERKSALQKLPSVPSVIGDTNTPENTVFIHPFSNAKMLVNVEPMVIVDRPEFVKPGLRLGDWSQVQE